MLSFLNDDIYFICGTDNLDYIDTWKKSDYILNNYKFLVINRRGKREVGQLGVIDLIVSILIAELVAISIENIDKSIFLTIIPISVLVFIEVLFLKSFLHFLLKFHSFLFLLLGYLMLFHLFLYQ